MFRDIQKTIICALELVYAHKVCLLKALAFPSIATTVLLLTKPDKPGLLYTLIIVLLMWALYTILAVNTHRTILLGPQSIPDWGIYVPGGRELTFAFYTFILALIIDSCVFSVFYSTDWNCY